MPWNYVVSLEIIYSFYFGPCVILLKGSCDIKLFKISTAYDVWFSRYRPSNMKLAMDSALVLVFINFCGRCIMLDGVIIAPHCISMGQCKKDVTPLLTHWRYIFLALTYLYYRCYMSIVTCCTSTQIT